MSTDRSGIVRTAMVVVTQMALVLLVAPNSATGAPSGAGLGGGGKTTTTTSTSTTTTTVPGVSPLTVGVERQLSASPVGQRFSAAWNGQRYLVVWGEGSEVRGALVEPDGSSGPAFRILIGANGPNPVVAWNGKRFFVVAEYVSDGLGTRQLFGKMVSSQGEVSSNTVYVSRQLVSNSQPRGSARASVAGSAASNTFYVAWQDWTPYGSTIFGEVVTDTGVAGPPTALAEVTSSADPPDNPSVASDGKNFMVVWDHWSGLTPNCWEVVCLNTQIFGTPVTAQGQPLIPLGKQITMYSKGPRNPSLASDGSRYFLTWRQGAYDVRAAPLSIAATVDGSPVDVTGTIHYSGTSAVTWDGKSFVVAWTDSRGGIYGGRVTASGVAQDAAGVPLASTGGGIMALAGASPSGKGILAYPRPNIAGAYARIWSQ